MAHIHPNNRGKVYRSRGIEVPTAIEVTLLRNDRLLGERRSLRFPHPLDRKNVGGRTEIVLPELWH